MLMMSYILDFQFDLLENKETPSLACTKQFEFLFSDELKRLCYVIKHLANAFYNVLLMATIENICVFNRKKDCLHLKLRK